MHFLKKRSRQGCVNTIRVIDNLVWCRRGQDQRVFTCLNGREPVRVTPETSFIGIAARSVDDCKPHACTGVLELRKKTIDAHPVPTHIPFVPNLRVDRDHIVLTARLHSVARKIDKHDWIGPYPRFETIDRAYYVGMPGILDVVHKEAVVTKCICQGACITSQLL